MYQAEGCALVCKYKYKQLHILQSQNYGKTTTNICGTSLCMTYQISVGITNKHQCAIYTHMIPNEMDAKAHFSDDSFQSYIKTFLINSKEENIKDGFWQEPENNCKTSNIDDIVGSMIINLSIALHLNKFEFDSKMN